MITESPLRMEFTMHFERKQRGKKTIATGAPTPPRIGHVPRVARVLALAHHFDHLFEQGVVKDYAEIARLAQMTRARVTQIMYLKYLALAILECIAQLDMTTEKDPISEKRLRRIAQIPDWDRQQEAFANANI